MATRDLVARCHCNQIRLHFSVPEADLPLPAHTCHCSICRRTHGTLALWHAKISSELTPNPLELPIVTQSRVSPESKIIRLFCSSCGTHLGEEDDGWFVSTSIVEGGDETVFEHKEAFFVPSSIDGGASDWFPNRIRKWDTFPGVGEPLKDDSWKKDQKSLFKSNDAVKNSLSVHCYCGGVTFSIRRPEWEGEAFRKDFPDLIMPPEDEDQRNFRKELKDGTWWIPSDRSKYLGNACFCTSDRLSSGAELHSWAFVPTAFISLEDGSPFKSEFGTLKHYESSPDVIRRFCGTCGALVFWHHTAERPMMIDVTVGLFDAPSGARAEDWVSWRKKGPSYAEDGVNKKLVKELTAGYLRWVNGT